MWRKRLGDCFILLVALALGASASLLFLILSAFAPMLFPGFLYDWGTDVWLTLLALNAVLAVVTLCCNRLNHAVLFAVLPIPAMCAVLVLCVAAKCVLPT